MVLIQCKSEKTFIRARDSLIEKGLFVYRKGKKGCPNAYRMVSFDTINPVNNTVNVPVFMTVETTAYPPVETTDITKQKQDQTILLKDKKKNRQAVAGDGQNNRTQDEQSVDSPLVGEVVDYLNRNTNNLTLEQMETPAQMAHKRIYDRILEKCTPLAFDGSNKRQEKRLINFAAARQQLAVAKRR